MNLYAERLDKVAMEMLVKALPDADEVGDSLTTHCFHPHSLYLLFQRARVSILAQSVMSGGSFGAVPREVVSSRNKIVSVSSDSSSKKGRLPTKTASNPDTAKQPIVSMEEQDSGDCPGPIGAEAGTETEVFEGVQEESEGANDTSILDVD
jgi:hypothetical protein